MYKFSIKIRSLSLIPTFILNYWQQTVICYRATCDWYSNK